jgi:hypothetical protein
MSKRLDYRMEKGVVRCFNNRRGYIAVEGGGIIPFSIEDGDSIAAGAKEPVFSEKGLLRRPEVGETLVFRRSWDKAAPWGFADEYSQAGRQIAHSLSPIIYRVFKKLTFAGGISDSKMKLLWRGSSITELSQKLRSFQKEFASREFEYRIIFQQSLDGGKTWQNCEDPRPFSGVVGKITA